jgi:hypothetical protein
MMYLVLVLNWEVLCSVLVPISKPQEPDLWLVRERQADLCAICAL